MVMVGWLVRDLLLEILNPQFVVVEGELGVQNLAQLSVIYTI
ncbi:uncharacterized protein G2W53_041151 [Senna tora]|uniref:Uncharacterized protein n=1 Tax=Senna tora TaxID=362788 RepID=A0A834VYY7_9FABA|nr:uncharacterized protein G2W53_041151 [Senna tora]